VDHLKLEHAGANRLRITGFPDAVKVIAISDLVSSHTTRQLARLAAYRQDLVFAQACANLLRDPPDSAVLRDALWRAAVVHYCKCYGKSRRGQLPFAKFLGRGIPRDAHKFFIDLRNEQFVHDDNDYSHAMLTGAVIAAEGKSYKIEKIICTSLVPNTLVEGNLGNLILLIDSALAWVISEFDKLCDTITAELEAEQYATLLSQPVWSITA
jgi:hypothetical protein